MAKRIASKRATSTEISAEQLEKIESEYHETYSRNQSLLEEVVYILSEKLKSKKLKVHAVEKRVKDLPSVIAKCKRDSIGDFSKLDDIVGARVVCLFRLDMEEVGQIISKNFEVVEIDDKLSIDNNPLGY